MAERPQDRAAPRTPAALFARYASVGVLNTALHWSMFAVLVFAGLSQAVSNLLAFCAAVTFSFLVNARFTFAEAATPLRYVLYVLFMGAMALGTGWAADEAGLHPLITLAGFSAFSLVAGFLYSRLVVFRSPK